MNPLRKLAGQTAVYGLSSIIGRFLNFLLVPLHTRAFSPEQFGVITEMYAYVAFLVVFLNYGLETAFFRFASRYPDDRNTVFSTALKSLTCSTLIFIGAAIIWAQPLADLLRYPDHKEFVIWFSIIVGFDALSAIPLARLRLEEKALRFASVNLISVGVNIALNIFFIWYCMPAYANGTGGWLVDTLYHPDIGVGYVFIANLVASIVKMILLVPSMLTGIRSFSGKLLRSMLRYGFPLILVGLAGIVNETIDRILLKYVLLDELGPQQTMEQVGIYGACYKLAIILSLFIQAFRYGAEPFFFSHEKHKDSKNTYARLLTYFVAFCCFVILGVLLYLDIFKYFIPNSDYWEGLAVVPILLFAYLFLGIYYNLSVWYKLSDNTGKGALVSILGAIVTIVINLLLIPSLGYAGSALATFFCYFFMAMVSWLWGKKHYPVPYNIPVILLYILTTIGLYFISITFFPAEGWFKYLLNTILLLVFLSLVWFREIRGKNLNFTRK